MEFYAITALAVMKIRAAGGTVWPIAPRRGTTQPWVKVTMPVDTERIDSYDLGFTFILPTDEAVITGTHGGLPTLDALRTPEDLGYEFVKTGG